MQRRVTELRRVVRRDVCRHADRNAGGAVCEKVREGARQHHRLLPLPVIGRAEVDGVLVDAPQHQLGDRRHARFRVAHGRGVIAVDVAEIALPVHERIADGEILRETYERVVDRLVAVRMEIPHHLADHLGGLLVATGRQEPHLAHRVDDAPMHRLQPVAHVRQRAVHDGGERIGEIALLERRPEIDRDDLAARAVLATFRRNHSFSHDGCLALPSPLRGGVGGGVVCAMPSSPETPIEALVEKLPTGARLAGLDLGTKTIGIALSDPGLRIATPFHTIRRTKFGKDAEDLLRLCAAEKVGGLVLGLPINMNGTEGPRAQATRAFLRSLAPLTDLPVVLWDERPSQNEQKARAERISGLAAAEANAKPKKPRGKKGKSQALRRRTCQECEQIVMNSDTTELYQVSRAMQFFR